MPGWLCASVQTAFFKAMEEAVGKKNQGIMEGVWQGCRVMSKTEDSCAATMDLI